MLRKKILITTLLIVCNFASAETPQGQIKKQQYSTKEEKTSFIGKVVIFLISAAIGTIIASHNNGRHAPENNNS